MTEAEEKKSLSVVYADPLHTEARVASQAIVRKYALEAVWPSDKKEHLKTIAYQMTSEIAGLFNRKMDDLSIDDIKRSQAAIDRVCGRYGVNRLRWSKIRGAQKVYSKVSMAYGYLSHVYWIGSISLGDFAPAIRKLGINFSGAPLSRAAGVWLVGQAVTELYWDPKGFDRTRKSLIQYHPVFDSLTLEHYRELALLMEIDAKVSWDETRMQKEILGALVNTHHNKVSALWSEPPDYRVILISLCEEMEIPNVNSNDPEEILEERLVQKVLAMSMDKMSSHQIAALESTIKKSVRDEYWKSSLKATAFAGSLVAGRLTGIGLYAAASTALAAVSNGLGITIAFSTYTSLSTALSLVFGPLGIGLATVTAVFHWTKSRPKKALPFVLYIATARGQLNMMNDKKPTLIQRAKLFLKRFFLR